MMANLTPPRPDWRVSDAVRPARCSGQVGDRAHDHGIKGQLLVQF